MTTVEARLFHGTRDVLPAELLPQKELVATLTRTFEAFGFAPVETPAMEYVDILLGKYGAEGEKLIYKLAYEDGQTLALRYDLTVPLSRLVAMHPELPKPFKRYQIQPVWRADRAQPAQGRFREFIQCDVDTVGTSSLVADAENLAVVHAGILASGMEGFVVKINHRKLLRGMIAHAGLPASADKEVLRVVDKLDKIGLDEVVAELSKIGVEASAIDRLVALMGITGTPDRVLAEASERLGAEAAAAEGIADLATMLGHARALGVPDARLRVDLSLTRGLDYYTGPVYEIVTTEIERFGSLGGGGRYDDLMSLFGGEPVPATGVSIGLTRLLTALVKLGKSKARASATEVLISRFPDTPVDAALACAAGLRADGFAVEWYYEADRLKKQFQYAERRGIPFVVILGRRKSNAARRPSSISPRANRSPSRAMPSPRGCANALPGRRSVGESARDRFRNVA
jgi:histidyl-tRNA synthetase